MKKLILLPLLALSTIQALQDQLVIPANLVENSVTSSTSLPSTYTLIRTLRTVESSLSQLRSELNALSLVTIWERRRILADDYANAEQDISANSTLLGRARHDSIIDPLCQRIESHFVELNNFFCEKLEQTIKQLKENSDSELVLGTELSRRLYLDLSVQVTLTDRDSNVLQERIREQITSLEEHIKRNAQLILPAVRTMFLQLRDNSSEISFQSLYTIYSGWHGLIETYVVILKNTGLFTDAQAELEREITDLTYQLNERVVAEFDALVEEIKGELASGNSRSYQLEYSKLAQFISEELLQPSEENEPQTLPPVIKLYFKSKLDEVNALLGYTEALIQPTPVPDNPLMFQMTVAKIDDLKRAIFCLPEEIRSLAQLWNEVSSYEKSCQPLPNELIPAFDDLKGIFYVKFSSALSTIASSNVSSQAKLEALAPFHSFFLEVLKAELSEKLVIALEIKFAKITKSTTTK